MGFKEIYLLGCENTSIINTVNSRLNETVKDYAYEITDCERKRMETMRNGIPIEGEFFALYKVFETYRALATYCKDRKVVLKNCTPKSLSDSIIEHIDLEEVLKG